jgi:apolipoprotein N-acyltransferase
MFDDGTPGESAATITAPPGTFGTPICFDCDYEGIARRMTAAGAEYLVVPTMDAESWSARQHDQHSELTRIRAAENGRWIFVVASSGISQIIDPTGHLHARLGAMERGTIQGFVKHEILLTPYTRFGWILPWCVLALGAASWIFLMFPKRQTAT